MSDQTITVEFPETIQSLGALREAAYRIIADASCLIDHEPPRYVCRLTLKARSRHDATTLRQHFLDVVTDENLREKLASETGPLRDVIVSLAFGALAADREKPEAA